MFTATKPTSFSGYTATPGYNPTGFTTTPSSTMPMTNTPIASVPTTTSNFNTPITNTMPSFNFLPATSPTAISPTTTTAQIHPLSLLEMLSLGYDSSRPDHCLFSHIFWNVSDEGDARIPVKLIGFDALRERSDSQSQRQLMIRNKTSELLERLAASIPILTQTDLRMNSLKKRLFYTQLFLLRLFKQLEIIRKHSIPVRNWERSLLSELDALNNVSTNSSFINLSKYTTSNVICTTDPKNGSYVNDKITISLDSAESIQTVLEGIQTSLELIVKNLNTLQSKVKTIHTTAETIL